MSGKVNGQKLFKCKPSHGLLVPVEYVQLLDDYEGANPLMRQSSSGSSIASANISRAQSVPNLAGRAPPSAPHIVEDFVPVESLPGLRIGDNVVWLGGENPQTGIVRWIGRSGRNQQLPMKAWVEMDDYMGFGHTEIDVGTRYGCAVGRGKFLPVDELILFENFFGQEEGSRDGSSDSGNLSHNQSGASRESDVSTSGGSPRVRIIPITMEESSNVSVDNLIDLGEPSENNDVSRLHNVADHDFSRICEFKQELRSTVSPASIIHECKLITKLCYISHSVAQNVAQDRQPDTSNPMEHPLPSIDDILREFSPSPMEVC
jgi:hypothetical protein